MTVNETPPIEKTPRSNRKAIALLVAAGILLGLAAIFAVSRGRQTQPAVPAVTEPADHGADHASEGPAIVRFEEESLKLADLGVEPVRYARRGARLAVTGTAEPNLGGVVKITPRVAGKIVSVSVNVGDTVKPGEALATLASTELAQAQAAYRQAAARASAAAANLVRQKKLADLGAFGQPKVEEARGRAAEAQGAVRTAQSEVSAARSEVAEARSELAAVQAALSQARTQERVTQSRFARAETLLKEELVSRQEWEQAQADAENSRSSVEAAAASVAQGRAKVETAQSHLRVAEARLSAANKQSGISDQALKREEAVFRGGYSASKEIVEAESALRQARLEQDAAANQIRLLGGRPGGGDQVAVTAPLGGRVTERAITLGETVTPEQALFTVINLNTVWVQLNVYPKDIASVRVGQRVEVTSDTAPGRTFTGVVSHVADVADETTRTVKVRCVIQNEGGRLKPSTFVRGVIIGAAGEPVLIVPKAAVQTMNGKPVVFVATGNPGEFETRPVVTGEAFGEEITIRSGLRPGERIVVKNAFVVKSDAVKGELEEH